MKKILVINIARMGDLVQSSPLISALKEQPGDKEVTLLCSEMFAPTAELIIGIDHVVTISFNDVVGELLKPRGGIISGYVKLRELTDSLKAERFDLVINITHTRYSAIIAWLVQGKETVGMTLDNEGYAIVNGDWASYYLNSCMNRTFNRFNLVDIHCRIGGVMGNGSLMLKQDIDAVAKAKKLLADEGLSDCKLVAVVPGASTKEKAWHPQLFAHAIKSAQAEVECTPVIFGARSEEEVCSKVAGLLPESINLCVKTDLKLLFALLAECEVCITNDTGPMHLAAAAGTRVLDISLGSALSHETAPYGEGHIVVEADIDCYPCQPKFRCNHKSCHDRINPTAVGKLLAGMVKKEDPDLTDPIFNRLLVHRTEYCADGYWHLVPLVKRNLNLKELHNIALREMWRRTLDGGFAWQDEYRQDVSEIIQSITKHYHINGSISSNSESLTNLLRFAMRGEELARQLTALSDDEKNNLNPIKHISDLIYKIDLDLIRIAYNSPELAPLIAQFTYAKENMQGWQLKSLAEQTIRLYRSLADWSEGLKQWVSNIQQGLNKLTTLPVYVD